LQVAQYAGVCQQFLLSMPVKKKKKLPSFGGANSAELQQLSALLPLLRSGALSQFVSGATPSQTSQPTKSPAAKPPPKAKDGWKLVKTKKIAETDAAAPTNHVHEILQPEGFNADVVAGVDFLTQSKACVALVSFSEAKKVVAELSSPLPMAILSTRKVDDKGEELAVLVKDKLGKLQTRTRFLVQLGAKPVTFNQSHFAKGGEVGELRKPVVVFLAQEKTSKDMWENALKNPKQMTDQWLRSVLQTESIGRIQEPRLSEGTLSAVAYVLAGNVDLVLKASGQQGVLSRPYWDSDRQPEMFAKVFLDCKHDREAALRIASSVKEKAWGLMSTKKGWAIRVLAADQQAIQTQTNPSFQVGKVYKVSGLPLSWHEENVKKILGDWDAMPIKSFRIGFRATWLVRSSQPPPATTLTNSDPVGLNVLAVISESEPRPQKTREVLRPANLKPGTGNAVCKESASQRQPPPVQRQPTAPKKVPSRDQPAFELPESALASIQAAIAAALAPLQAKLHAMDLELQEMGKLPPDMETESEAESEKEKGEDADMQGDTRSKRPLEEENNSFVTLRRKKTLERPARTQRKEVR
jgi:hypothetical protein